jgi:hypothetical protein
MKSIAERLSYRELILIGARVSLFGFIMSGPVSFMIVRLVKPQPPWTSAAEFAANYGIVQNIPFYFGFFLVAGMFMVVTGHYLNYSGSNDETRFHLLMSLGLTTVFSVLISFNYICQATFVHNLAFEYRPEYEVAISIFSMANPRSLCWAIEMWGYGLLGIGTLLLSTYYQGRSNWIQALLILNGFVSVASAVWMSIDVRWVMSPVGLGLYLAWNALMIAILILIYRDAGKLSKVHK